MVEIVVEDIIIFMSSIGLSCVLIIEKLFFFIFIKIVILGDCSFVFLKGNYYFNFLDVNL